MDTVLVGIKSIEQKIVDHLSIYKRCKNEDERHEVRGIIHGLELALSVLREAAKESLGRGEG